MKFEKELDSLETCEQPNQVPSAVVLSICIITYNHAAYIREAINSALVQHSDVSCEILIGEDDSNDGTREICIEYAEKYPDTIRLFLMHRRDNIRIMGRPTGRYNLIQTIQQARGRYVAILEGDDYWNDPLKCAKQLNVLQANKDCVGAFTNTMDLSGGGAVLHSSSLSLGRIGVANFIDGCCIRTCAVMIRKDVLQNLPSWVYEVPALDYALFWHLASLGDWFYLDDPAATYRLSSGGIWNSGTASFRHAGRLWPLIIGEALIERSMRPRLHARMIQSAMALVRAGVLERNKEAVIFGARTLLTRPILAARYGIPKILSKRAST